MQQFNSIEETVIKSLIYLTHLGINGTDIKDTPMTDVANPYSTSAFKVPTGVLAADLLKTSYKYLGTEQFKDQLEKFELDHVYTLAYDHFTGVWGELNPDTLELINSNKSKVAAFTDERTNIELVTLDYLRELLGMNKTKIKSEWLNSVLKGESIRLDLSYYLQETPLFKVPLGWVSDEVLDKYGFTNDKDDEYTLEDIRVENLHILACELTKEFSEHRSDRVYPFYRSSIPLWHGEQSLAGYKLDPSGAYYKDLYKYLWNRYACVGNKGEYDLLESYFFEMINTVFTSLDVHALSE